MAFLSKKNFIFLGLLIVGNLLPAQTPDTLIRIEEILVTAEKLSLSQVGNRSDLLDSADLAIHQQHNLVDVLSLQSTIFVKNYGPSNSATSALRGAASAHTPVLWNGFNLQSPMLGQVDLSLLPVLFTDEIRIQYGGGSSLWGSGPMGGIISLNNRTSFNEGNSGNFIGTIGSFGNYKTAAKGTLSNRRFIHTTRAFFLTGKNDFEYEHAPGDLRRLTNARNTQYGIMQENHFKLSNQQILGLYAWYQKADRQLPPATYQDRAETSQKDNMLRLMAHWTYQGTQLYWQARMGVFREHLIYADPAFNYTATNTAWTALTEVETRWAIDEQNQLTFGIHNTWITAQSDSYIEDVQQNRTALFTAYRWTDAQNNWRTVWSIRQELVGNNFSPFVPSIGLERRLGKRFHISAMLSRNYRLPALNDLFFFGGNPNLKAEKGWSEELGLQWKRHLDRQKISYQITAFNRKIQNWIIWLPNEDFSIWSPQNIREVWSRGIENIFHWEAGWQDWHTRLDFRYDYIRSTNETVEESAKDIQSKQLIYVPRHRLMAGVELGFRNWALLYRRQYTGKVYTQEDHTASLPAYHIDALILQYSHKKGQLFARVNNLWDKNYQIIQYYPQPGRHFEIGFSLH